MTTEVIKTFDIEDLFKKFIDINKLCNDNLLEISVKQHQVTLMFEETLIHFADFLKLPFTEQSYITTYNDNLFITIENLSLENMEESNPLYIFISVISQLYETICTCPSLEFVITGQYMKCFLDKPGLRVEDLNHYEEILNAKGKGELELHPQRAYLFFINSSYIED